ncbi:MAG: PTS sugar transporter subunit IIA [Pseudomonadota bacterium]|jgi:PTS system nitrogen regulatory IIA component
MHIADLLTPSRVVADVRVTSKKRLLEQLATLLDERQGETTERAIYDSLVKRERLGSTGLSHGVAIPHGRSPAIQRAAGAFVRLAEAVDFGAVDGQPVDLVFALVVPEHFTDQHLMFLAELAETFSDPATLSRLRAARDAAQLYELLSRSPERTAAA